MKFCKIEQCIDCAHLFIGKMLISLYENNLFYQQLYQNSLRKWKQSDAFSLQKKMLKVNFSDEKNCSTNFLSRHPTYPSYLASTRKKFTRGLFAVIHLWLELMFRSTLFNLCDSLACDLMLVINSESKWLSFIRFHMRAIFRFPSKETFTFFIIGSLLKFIIVRE